MHGRLRGDAFSRPCSRLLSLLTWCGLALDAHAAGTQARYFAHDAVTDRHGVIAPWYPGQNGLVDYRVRVAAEFLKRYPWVGTDRSVMAGPHWIFNARVDLDRNGGITVLPATDTMNGNLGQRFKYITEALPRYYRYTGDPVVFGQLRIAADFFLENDLTPADHPWPRFPISVPVAGKPYGKAAPGGWIQLDLSAGIGLGMLRVYEMTGDARYLAAARHVGEVLAEHCDTRPDAPPWKRYAEGGEPPWGKTVGGNRLTGGVANILILLDELIRLSPAGSGPDLKFLRARDAGRAYLRDRLLPAWTATDTWGRHYWDWEHPVQGILPTGWVAQYLMDHPDAFPDWKDDVRNILGLYLNRACVSPESGGDVYSGAWAYPEGCACCGRSLDVCPVFLARHWACYGVLADSPWAREVARRKTILSFYHFRDSGVVEDNIDGGQITAREWSELIGFGPILCGLEVLGWMPEVFGPPRENHLVRSATTVREVFYGRGRVAYSGLDAAGTTPDVLRLAFRPRSATGDGRPLPSRPDLKAAGFTADRLDCGDWIVTIRREGVRSVLVTGDDDPQQVVDDGSLTYEGRWTTEASAADLGGACHVAGSDGAAVVCPFEGNQVRLIGLATPDGGLADVILDGVKQPVGVDCWSPEVTRHQQVLYYRNGLPDGPHVLKIAVKGERNLASGGTRVSVDAVQWSAAVAPAAYGSGGGPTREQRMIFGDTRRRPYVDLRGNLWRPGTEFVVRTGSGTDPVVKTWWTDPAPGGVTGTPDPELYRHGVHAPEFWVNLTVGPGVYRVRLHFAERRGENDPARRPLQISINGQERVRGLDVAGRAGGLHRAFALQFDDVRPRNGVIEVRLAATGGEAILQALEVLP